MPIERRVHRHSGIRLRLRTILMLVNLLVLVLPLCSIYFLRTYENELVRQTEGELLVQGAYIAASFKQRLREVAGGVTASLGKKAGTALVEKLRERDKEPFHPIPATLDLFSAPVFSPRPEAERARVSPDTLALDAGALLTPVLKDAQRTTLAGVRVLDHHGIVVASTGGEVGESLAHTREVMRALGGLPLSILRERIMDEPLPSIASISRGSSIRVFVAVPVILDAQIVGAVYLSRTPRSILKALYEEKVSIIVSLAILLSVAVILGLFTSYSITRPVSALIRQTRALAKGEKSEPFPTENVMAVEVTQLADAFETMAGHIEFRTNYIRDFAMHVSHEFKTPLTSIQGTVELLQHHLEDMSDEQRERFLANMGKDTDRLQRLVTRLLELARADVYEPTSEIADVEAVGGQLRERYKELGLFVDVVPAETPVRVPVASDVLETILDTLLENSRRHGADEVRVMFERKNSHVDIVVADNGEGISEANRPKVFTPFFTTNRKHGGTGLGLSIVRALLSAHKGGIELDAIAQHGASFIITLPCE